MWITCGEGRQIWEVVLVVSFSAHERSQPEVEAAMGKRPDLRNREMAVEIWSVALNPLYPGSFLLLESRYFFNCLSLIEFPITYKWNYPKQKLDKTFSFLCKAFLNLYRQVNLSTLFFPRTLFIQHSYYWKCWIVMNCFIICFLGTLWAH